MEIWETIEFGTRAMALKLAAGKSTEEMHRVQHKRLQELVSHAREHSIHWREKLAGIGSSSFDLADLPTSNKPELMENFERALTVDNIRRDEVESFMEDHSNLGKYFQDEYVLSHTSGSQGQPLLIVQPKTTVELLFALQVARGNHKSLSAGELVKHLIEPARLAAVTLKRGFYPSSVAFEYIPAGAQQFVEARQFSSSDDDLIEQLAEYRPTHLTSYASILHELAREVEAGRLLLKPELEQVINISERLMPKAREHYEEIFGAPVLDDYGMGECMFLCNGCSTSAGMHVNADWAILEVVDENNKPVAPGTKGAKVLVTNLANYVQPIIRYEVGDIVTMATDDCQCGHSLPLVAGIEGRDSDMFYIETEGKRRALSPTVFELALGRITDAREFQIIQEKLNEFRILLEPLPGATFKHDRAKKVMDEQLREYGLDSQLKVKLETVDRLASDPDKKFKRIVSKVDADEQKASK